MFTVHSSNPECGGMCGTSVKEEGLPSCQPEMAGLPFFHSLGNLQKKTTPIKVAIISSPVTPRPPT